MPRIPDEPLLKVTLNLYKADVEWFQDRFGQGYSERIRATLRNHITRIKLLADEYIQEE